MALNGKAVVFMHNLVGLNFLIVPQTQDSVQVLLNQFNFYGQHYVTNAFRLIPPFLGGKKKNQKSRLWCNALTI